MHSSKKNGTTGIFIQDELIKGWLIRGGGGGEGMMLLLIITFAEASAPTCNGSDVLPGARSMIPEDPDVTIVGPSYLPVGERRRAKRVVSKCYQ